MNEPYIHKYTEGCVKQTFNREGKLLGQIFLASAEVEWIGLDDILIDCPNDSWYHPFMMVQPTRKIMIFEVLIPTTCVAVYRVSADNADDAKQQVLNGNGESVDYDKWVEDTDSNNWRVLLA